jgi:hypothetical protein
LQLARALRNAFRQLTVFRRVPVLGPSDPRLPKVLHVTLALIIALEGALNVTRGLSGERDFLLVCFGAAEAVGALFFVWPRTLAVGACILVCTFLIAAAFHVVEHDFPSEHLVYTVSILVVLAQRRRPLGSGVSTS